VVDLRDYLAEERTLLAWIRTGLALMGFGFAVARFGSADHPESFSMWLGTALIAAGVAVNLMSTRQYGADVSRSVAVLALFLALVGIAMAIYLPLA
jgi:putative membrane protein